MNTLKLRDYIGTSEASEITGCTEAYLRQLLKRGELIGEKVSPRLWLVSRRDAKRLAKQTSHLGRPRSGNRKN